MPTTREGRAYVFIAVDHCSGAFIGTHASSSASQWEALEPVRQGVTCHFGGVGPDIRTEQTALEPKAATGFKMAA